jgi:hypothetical protein
MIKGVPANKEGINQSNQSNRRFSYFAALFFWNTTIVESMRPRLGDEKGISNDRRMKRKRQTERGES